MAQIKDKFKPIYIVAIVFYVISLILSFAGMVMMFLDNDYYSYSHYSYYYGYSYEYRYIDYPETGIMPFFGFLLLLIGLIVFAVATKKNKLAGIATIVLDFIAQLLLYLSCLLMHSDTALIGWILCCTAASLMGLVVLLEIIYIACSKAEESKQKQANNANNKKLNALDYNKCADLLLEAYTLNTFGMLSSEEYLIRRGKILKQYNLDVNMSSTLLGSSFDSSNKNSFNGSYKNDEKNVTVNLNNGEYTYEINGKTIKSGLMAADKEGKTIKLDLGEGKIAVFKVKEDAICLENGLSFRKLK